MAFSAEDLDALEDAIATGALEVEYEDRKVRYRSLNEMLRARDLVRKKLGLIDGSFHDRRASSTKGL